MIRALRRLSRISLLSLADSLASGRVSAPYAGHTLRPFIPDDTVDAVSGALRELSADGMMGKHIATMLRLLAEERFATQRQVDRVRAVWSPPEFDRIDARDTVAVVRELFNDAQRHVDIVTFALDGGDKAKSLFGALAGKMDTDPELKVRVFVNIHRKYQDDTSASQLIRLFRNHFQRAIWPGTRLPEVYYDPRSVVEDNSKRAVLHAKAIIVDQRKTLLTSANFTEAAQERNIEAGVVIEDDGVAKPMLRQLDYLIEDGTLINLRVQKRC